MDGTDPLDALFNVAVAIFAGLAGLLIFALTYQLAYWTVMVVFK